MGRYVVLVSMLASAGLLPGRSERPVVMNLLRELPREKPVLGDPWKSLPAVESRPVEPLPNWATTLAPAMPKTVAAMLELDYIHRAKSPLPPKLRAKMRWVA